MSNSKKNVSSSKKTTEKKLLTNTKLRPRPPIQVFKNIRPNHEVKTLVLYDRSRFTLALPLLKGWKKIWHYLYWTYMLIYYLTFAGARIAWYFIKRDLYYDNIRWYHECVYWFRKLDYDASYLTIRFRIPRFTKKWIRRALRRCKPPRLINRIRRWFKKWLHRAIWALVTSKTFEKFWSFSPFFFPVFFVNYVVRFFLNLIISFINILYNFLSLFLVSSLFIYRTFLFSCFELNIFYIFFNVYNRFSSNKSVIALHSFIALLSALFNNICLFPFFILLNYYLIQPIIFFFFFVKNRSFSFPVIYPINLKALFTLVSFFLYFFFITFIDQIFRSFNNFLTSNFIFTLIIRIINSFLSFSYFVSSTIFNYLLFNLFLKFIFYILFFIRIVHYFNFSFINNFVFCYSINFLFNYSLYLLNLYLIFLSALSFFYALLMDIFYILVTLYKKSPVSFITHCKYNFIIRYYSYKSLFLQLLIINHNLNKNFFTIYVLMLFFIQRFLPYFKERFLYLKSMFINFYFNQSYNKVSSIFYNLFITISILYFTIFIHIF